MSKFKEELDKIRNYIKLVKREIDYINNTIESYPNIISLNIKIYKYEIDGIYRYTYVKFGDIPDEYQRKFADWMIGQTCGVIDEKLVPYAWDLERWLNLKINKVPTYWD